MQLTIMMSDRANDIGSLDSACSGMTCDAKRIVCVALGNLIGFPDAFCDVPLGLSYRNFEEDSKPCDKLFSHDAHKGGIPGRTPLACGILQGDYAFGNLLVAAGTKSAEHIRRVASGFSALQVVCFQLYTVTVGAAVLAGVIVPPEHILTHIVESKHLTLLIVLSLRDRLTIKHCFDELQVKFRGFHHDICDREDTHDPQDGCDMLLDLYLYGGCKPALVLGMGAVIKPGLAVSGFSVPPGSAKFSPCGEIIDHIAARFTSAAKSSSLSVDAESPIVLLPASTPRVMGWV